jgi:uncharacterized protein (UPF0179 family)
MAEELERLRENFARQGEAKLRDLKEEAEQCELELQRVVTEFAAKARAEEEWVQATLESRKARSGAIIAQQADAGASDEDELVAQDLLSKALVEKWYSLGDIGPGWKI